MSDLDLDAIMASYRENRARAHAWRVVDQIPVLITEVRRLSALAVDVVGPAPATLCCCWHNRNCEPPSELCCDQCSEWDHPSHASGTECIAPDLSGVGPAPATPDEGAATMEARLETAIPGFRADLTAAIVERNEARVALAAAEAELAAFRAECDKVGIPHDAEGLVRHHRGNAGAAGAAQGMAEYARRLTAAEAQRDAWRELAEARNELLACYRVGQRPPERLMGRIFAARQAVADLSVEATGTEQHAFKAWAYIGEDRCGQRIGPVLCCKPAADPIHAAVEATGTEGGGGHE